MVGQNPFWPLFDLLIAPTQFNLMAALAANDQNSLFQILLEGFLGKLCYSHEFSFPGQITGNSSLSKSIHEVLGRSDCLWYLLYSFATIVAHKAHQLGNLPLTVFVDLG